MDTDKQLSIMLRGLDEDEGDVRFNNFIQQLDILKKALTETQKIYSKKAFAYFKVVELRHKSPACIVLEAVPHRIEDAEKTQVVVDKFFQSLDEIDSGRYPDGFSYETFTSYKDITSLREKKRITEIVISRNGDIQRKLEDFSRNIEKILGTDEFEIGSYTGMLEAINIHGNQNVFYVYPTSHMPKLKCLFPKDLKEIAISAIGHYVTVTGRKRYKPNISGAISYEMRIQDMVSHPPEDDLPSLADLKGIAPDITGNENSENFVRGIRNEW